MSRRLLHEIKNKKGGVIFTAHLGNIEIARALAKLIPGVKINALVFSEHALNLNRTLKAINPEYDLNLIHIKQPNIALSIDLKEKIDQGEFVVIAADRTSVLNPKQNTTIEFLKRDALFPQGAFILAHLLESKVFLMLCLKEKKAQQFSIYFDLLFEKIVLDRKNRDENLKDYTKIYAKELEKICVSYPYQWFNFYSFWHDNQKESD